MVSIVKNLIPYVVAAILVSFLISVLIPLSKKIGLVDKPDQRKQHYGAVPLVGGIAMAVSLALSILLFQISFHDFRLLFFCIGVLTIIGALDDQRELKPTMKVFAQLLVALLMTIIGGTIVVNVGDIFAINRSMGLAIFAIPLTVISIVGVINAFNMIDGHDGLAAVVTILGLLGLSVLLYFRATTDDYQYVVIIFLLITLLTVFLVFNLGLMKASNRIFLGDAGSMFLGLIMVFLLIQLSQREAPVVSTTAAAWIIGVPLLDMFSVITTRILSRVSLLKADRNHIHHLLEQHGFRKGQVLAILAMLQVVFVSIGVFGTLLEWPDAALFWGAFLAFTIYFLILVASGMRFGR